MERNLGVRVICSLVTGCLSCTHAGDCHSEFEYLQQEELIATFLLLRQVLIRAEIFPSSSKQFILFLSFGSQTAD